MSTPKEKLAKWLELLRSGDFTQGHKTLKTECGDYCCLGVYAAGVLGYGNELHGHGYIPMNLVWDVRFNKPVTPSEIELFETAGTSNVREGVTRQSALAQLNDALGWSFDSIADFIEVLGWHEVEGADNGE